MQHAESFRRELNLPRRPHRVGRRMGFVATGARSLSRPTEAEAGLQEDRLKPELQTPFGSDGVMPAIRFGVPTYGCALFK